MFFNTPDPKIFTKRVSPGALQQGNGLFYFFGAKIMKDFNFHVNLILFYCTILIVHHRGKKQLAGLARTCCASPPGRFMPYRFYTATQYPIYHDNSP